MHAKIRSHYLQRRLAVIVVVLGICSGISIAAVVKTVSSSTQSVRHASQPITGNWLIDFTRKEPDQVQLTMIHGADRRGPQNWGRGVAISEIQGLSRELAFRGIKDVRLRLVREAGVFDLEGSFNNGKGSGRWTLTPSESFVAAMTARGYENLSGEDLFSAAMSELSIKGMDELSSAGYGKLKFAELIEAQIFKVTSDYINDLRSAGYDGLRFKELVEGRIFRIDSRFAKEVETLGFPHQPLKKLVELRIFEVTPEYVGEMRAAGYGNLSLNKLVEFRIHKVTPAFINEVKAEGVSSISADDAVTLRIHKIDADFIRRAKAQGLKNLTVDELVEMRLFNRVK